jgi:hypothetical protein
MVMVDQEKLVDIFDQLKKMFKKYEKKLNVKMDVGHRYELEGTKEYEVTSKRTGKTTKKRNAYFGGLIIQSSYVGLYLMAPYLDIKLFEKVFPNLMKTLKGKSCFWIKELNPELKKEIRNALKLSYQVYKDKGWV